MPTELGRWLRAQRQARSWNVPEMTRQLRRAATGAGDKLPANECLYTMIRRWERGETGVSERYLLHYCRALEIEPDQFGPHEPGPTPQPPPGSPVRPPAAVTPPGALAPWRALVPGVTAPPALPGLAYRWIQEPDLGGSGIEREVLMAAHEGSDHAEHAERRDIGDATLEQMRDDVIRLSHAYMGGVPFPLFQEMRSVRARMYAALDRRLWPRDATALYFLVGGLNGLMSQAAQDLGYPRAAAELVRSGWGYAVAIDHRPLMGYLRAGLADISHWQGQPRKAHELALGGLQYLPEGPGAARLHLLRAQAAAGFGDADEARRAVTDAAEARHRGPADELQTEIGGQLAFGGAKQAYLAGSTLTQLPGSDTPAVGELGSAIGMFETGPAEERSYGCEAIARINLALIRIRNGDLDTDDLRPVFGLPADKRIDALRQRLAIIRTELAKPQYQGSARANGLDEQIENFGREMISAGLREITDGSA